MILRDILFKTTDFFKTKGLETPRLDAELLIADVLEFERIELYTNHLYPLEKEQVDRCREYVKRRSNGEPVAYILGYKDFFRRRFRVSSSVLIPRPETEILVEQVLETVKALQDTQAFSIADFGCGSGCIGLSLLKESDFGKLISVDASLSALEVAQQNAQLLVVNHRVQFIGKRVQDLTVEDIPVKLDIIVANPPYIDRQSSDFSEVVAKYEPSEALFSADNGVMDLKQWAEKAFDLLKPGGYYFCEIGYNQGDILKAYLEALGFNQIRVLKDYSDFDRIISAQK